MSDHVENHEKKKYGIIYADPPWNYRVYSQKGLGRSAESHYPTMSIEDICALPVGKIAADNCALFMWIKRRQPHSPYSAAKRL